MRLTLVAALAAALAVVAPAGAAVTFTFTQTERFETVTANPCIGKAGGSVTFEGFVHQELHISVDDNGGKHVHNSIDFHLRSVEEDQPAPRYVATAQTHFTANDVEATEFTFVTPIVFVTTGKDTSSDDFKLLLVNHVTLDANGRPTASVFEIKSDCQ